MNPFLFLIPVQRARFRELCAFLVFLSISASGLLAEPFAPGEVLIKFKDGVSLSEQQQIIESLNLSTEGYIGENDSIGFHRSATPNMKAVLAGLSANGAIEYAQPNYTYTAIATSLPSDDPELVRQWNLDVVAAPQAWAEESGSPVIVAVIDAGIDYTHPDLAGNMWVNTGEVPDDGIDNDGNGFVDDVYGYDFTEDDTDGDPGEDGDPMDDELAYHGTAVAGVIAAVRNNGTEIAGVTANVRIMALRAAKRDIYDGKEIILTHTREISQCIDYAINNGAHIITISAEGGSILVNDIVFSNAIGRAEVARGGDGILIVGGASNKGVDIDSSIDVLDNATGESVPGGDGKLDNVSYPANFPNDNLIVTTSVTRGDRLSSFASYGAKSVDLGAPGELIPTLKTGGEWIYTSGNSVAVPHVAGAAAMLLASQPTLTAQEVKYILMENAERVPDLTSSSVSGGRLNIYQAMTASTVATNPAWWRASGTGIIERGRVPDNYAPITIGQLKHVAKMARNYLDDALGTEGGAGSSIDALVDAFVSNGDADYGPANLGQLKAIANPFYNRLNTLGHDRQTKGNLIRRGYPVDWAHNTPWDPNTPVEENYAVANIGQLKMIFSFDFENTGALDPEGDEDGDSVPNGLDVDLHDNTVGELNIKITFPTGGSI